MPRKKKLAKDLTTEEAIKKLFPKKVVDKAREAASSDTKQSIKKEDK
jgi:hypothetical protein